MTKKTKLVAVVGSANAKSRTRVLAEALVGALQARHALDVHWLDVGTLAPHIGSAVSRDALDSVGAAAVAAIENADAVLAATPVYKGSYSGLFKHLLDFVHPDALVGRPVLLAATGGSDRHALVVDHQLRPLFAFFRALAVPSAVYASEADFNGHAIASETLTARVQEAATQAAGLLDAARAQALPAAA